MADDETPRPAWTPSAVPTVSPNLSSNRRVPWRPILFVLGAIFVFLLFQGTFVVVQAGERAVIFSKISGMKRYQLAEGLHFSLPFIWVPTKYDVRSRTYTMSGTSTEGSEPGNSTSGDDSLSALTSDGLPVTLDLSVRFHIDPDNVWRLHRYVGAEFVSSVVRPQTRSVTRMVVAQYPVIDVYSAKRQAIIDQIQRELTPRFAANYLILDEVLLRDVRFPEEFQAAIEQKQVAQQAAQQMVFEVDRARSEKQQKIVAAEGDAAAIRSRAQALAQNPLLLPYEYIQSLSPDARVIVSDGRSIVNLGDVFGGEPAPAQPKGGPQQ